MEISTRPLNAVNPIDHSNDIDHLFSIASSRIDDSPSKSLPHSASGTLSRTREKIRNRIRSFSAGNKDIAKPDPSFVSGLKSKKAQDIDNIIAVAERKDKEKDKEKEGERDKGKGKDKEKKMLETKTSSLPSWINISPGKQRSSTIFRTATGASDIDGYLQMGKEGIKRCASFPHGGISALDSDEAEATQTSTISDTENLPPSNFAQDSFSKRRKRGFTLFSGSKRSSSVSIDSTPEMKRATNSVPFPRVDFIQRNTRGEDVPVLASQAQVFAPIPLAVKEEQIDIDKLFAIGEGLEDTASSGQRNPKRRRWSLPTRINRDEVVSKYRVERKSSRSSLPNSMRRYRSTPIEPILCQTNAVVGDMDIDNLLQIGNHCAFLNVAKPTEAHIIQNAILPDADEVFNLQDDTPVDTMKLAQRPIVKPALLHSINMGVSMEGFGSSMSDRTAHYLYVGHKQDMSELVESTEEIYKRVEKKMNKASKNQKPAQQVVNTSHDEVSVRNSNMDIDQLVKLGHSNSSLSQSFLRSSRQNVLRNSDPNIRNSSKLATSQHIVTSILPPSPSTTVTPLPSAPNSTHPTTSRISKSAESLKSKSQLKLEETTVHSQAQPDNSTLRLNMSSSPSLTTASSSGTTNPSRRSSIIDPASSINSRTSLIKKAP
ncbi:hypothetical protein BKA69DRAFT_1076560 [Paraphysoderma sedebokerense]|nr:hypothetical protein BKA69DRAFT_1076560 [Paraphysoderma sedebokerense]